MKSVVIVDRDEGRRIALKTFLEPDDDVLECATLPEVARLAKGSQFRALILSWLPGGPERWTPSQNAQWSSAYVVLVLLVPRDFSPEQTEAEERRAIEWSNKVFPTAAPKLIRRFAAREIRRVVLEVFGRREIGPPDEVIDEGKAQQILGKDVQVLRKIGEGATSTVFIAIDPMKHLRAYKLARLSRVAQFDAVRKAISLIWGTPDGAAYLLNATANYCRDPAWYFVAAALLDDASGSKFDINIYRPKTLLSWLSSLERSNGALGRNDALALMGYLVSALEGLRFLHRHGLAYNDVHPGNIGFFGNRPVWIDYSAITFPGDVPHEGSQWYIVPEKRDAATPALDCYSLVKILVGSLYDLHPAIIQPTVIDELSKKHCKGLFGEVMRHIACRGLAPDPTKRYQSASELMSDLQHAKGLLAEDMV